MVIAVFGPTCAGKSTFIRNSLNVPDSDVVFAHQLGRRDPRAGQAVHYNLLFGAPSAAAVNPATSVDLLRLGQLLDTVRLDRCYVLECPLGELVARASVRKAVEPGIGATYDSARWIRILREADLPACYELLFRTLESRGIAWTRLDTGGSLAA